MRDDDNQFSGTLVLVFFGLIALYAVIGLIFGLFGPFTRDLAAFSTGNYADITAHDVSVSLMIANAMTMVATMLPVTATLAIIVRRFINFGPEMSGPTIKLIHSQPGKKPLTGWKALIVALHKIAALVFYEEFYTRWMFLGILGGLAWFQGPVAFYTLFLIGNGAWAIIHLTNYPAGTRNPLRILPHFFLGIPFTIMFLRYGLLGAFVGHFVWNMVPVLPSLIDQTRRGVPLTLRSTG